MLGITTLYHSMILSTLSISSHCFWFFSKYLVRIEMYSPKFVSSPEFEDSEDVLYVKEYLGDENIRNNLVTVYK